jgi:hypothetical protein
VSPAGARGTGGNRAAPHCFLCGNPPDTFEQMDAAQPLAASKRLRTGLNHDDTTTRRIFGKSAICRRAVFEQKRTEKTKGELCYLLFLLFHPFVVPLCRCG